MQLMTAQIRRFSELKPAGVESNLFQYHLRHVIKEGYVEKVPGGYSLSPKGLHFADRYTPVYKTVREQPKIITVEVIKNSAGQVLLQQKLRQPWVGEYHLPAGKIHENESLTAAARRELVEKTDLIDIDLTYKATAHIVIVRGEDLISEFVAFIFEGNFDGKLDNAVWYDSSKALKLAPSVAEILELVPSNVPYEINLEA